MKTTATVIAVLGVYLALIITVLCNAVERLTAITTPWEVVVGIVLVGGAMVGFSTAAYCKAKEHVA